MALALLPATGCGPDRTDRPVIPTTTETTRRYHGPTAHPVDTAAIERLIAAEAPADPALMPPGSAAARIRANGVLRVGGALSTPLFSLLDPAEGHVTGLDAGLSQLLAKYIIGEPRTQLVPVTPATREALLQNGSVDTVVATYTMTSARPHAVAFAGPYFMDGLAIQVRRGTTDITSLADLNGKSVVTPARSTVPPATAVPALLAGSAPAARIQLLQTNAECLRALRSRRADAYLFDQSVLAGNASRSDDVIVLPGTFTAEAFGIGLPVHQPDLPALVNGWLRKIETDGSWASLWKATVGTQVPGDPPVPPDIAPGTAHVPHLPSRRPRE